MTFREVKYFRHKLKFKYPLTTSSVKYSEKDVMFVWMEDELGRISIGEASPLKEFTGEEFEEICSLALRFKTELLQTEFPNIQKCLGFVEMELSRFPSLAFAFECALQGLEQSTNQKQLQKVKTSGLVGLGSYSAMKTDIDSLIMSGFDTIKIKIDRNTVVNAMNLISLPEFSKIRFRLDANGAFEFDEARESFSRSNLPNLEYIEQPVSTMDEMLELQKAVNINLAPDESVRNIVHLEKLLAQESFKFIVIKPMVLGSFFKVRDILRKSSSSATNIIISSAFESSVARSALYHLALHSGHEFAHGIISTEWYLNDLSIDKLLCQSISLSEINELNTPV